MQRNCSQPGGFTTLCSLQNLWSQQQHATYLKAFGRADMGRNNFEYSTAAPGPPTKGAVHQIQ